jgi:hypothetical protein
MQFTENAKIVHPYLGFCNQSADFIRQIPHIAISSSENGR